MKQRKDRDEKLKQLRQERNKLERLNRELDIRIFELYTLYNISKMLNISFAIEEVFLSTIDAIGKSLLIDKIGVLMVDECCGELVMRACYPDPGILPDVRIKIGEGICGTVARTGRPAIINDLNKEPVRLPYMDEKISKGAFLCIPLIGKQGNILGVFNVHKVKAGSINANDMKLFPEVAQQVALAVEKAVLYEKAKEASMRDELTDLHNRRYFFEYLERESARANRYNKCFSVLMIDIDHFKNFNDKNGHIKGDEALRELARLLASKLRCSDSITRYGGEEFVCLLPETVKSSATVAAEKIRKTVAEHRFDGGENQPEGRMTITIGVATWPDDAQSAIDIVDQADRALYRGKSIGRNTVCSKVLSE